MSRTRSVSVASRPAPISMRRAVIQTSQSQQQHDAHSHGGAHRQELRACDARVGFTFRQAPRPEQSVRKEPEHEEPDDGGKYEKELSEMSDGRGLRRG